VIKDVHCHTQHGLVLEVVQRWLSACAPSCVLFQILNAAYHVEVTFHSGSSVTRMLWEQIKQVSVPQRGPVSP
jgi:hypothetical protein